jgi:lysophospholipase L1-like esterase
VFLLGKSTSGALATKLAVALAALSAALLAAEIAFRVAWTRDELDPYTAGLRSLLVAPHPYLAYANKPGYRHDPTPAEPWQSSHNELGFRGPETTWEKPEGRYRILCLGGSSTYGFGSSGNVATWPARLEQHLRGARPDRDIEVINAGCQGYSTHESLINLELRGVEFAPDLVLVYHSINDVRCALYPGAARDNSHWRQVWPVERPTALQRGLERSYLFLAWRFYLTDWWEQRRDLMTYVVVDAAKRRGQDYYLNPTSDQGFSNFHRNLVSIVALARRHGARVALITQGCYEEGAGLKDALSRELQIAGMARAREILYAVGKEDGVPVIDAETVLEAACAAGEPIFTDEVHLQDRGADLLGQTVAQELLELGWL